jgi:hypothetical protein
MSMTAAEFDSLPRNNDRTCSDLDIGKTFRCDREDLPPNAVLTCTRIDRELQYNLTLVEIVEEVPNE